MIKKVKFKSKGQHVEERGEGGINHWYREFAKSWFSLAIDYFVTITDSIKLTNTTFIQQETN